MSEFVGRTGSLRVYSYPEAKHSGPGGTFARNFATGPKTDFSFDNTGAVVSWNEIDAGPAAGEDVQITCLSTGIVLIQGVLTVGNSSGDPSEVTVQIGINGISILPFPQDERFTVPAGQLKAVPFLVETIAADTPVGTPTNINVVLTASSGTTLFLVADSSSVNVQEVSVATG